MEDADIRQILGDLTGRNWQGVVFRHMLGESPADRENRRGARWNPPEIPAIYTSLSKEVALAEGSYHFNMQPIAPRARRTIFRINIRLGNVLDLTDHKTLARLGLVPQPTDPWEHEFSSRIVQPWAWMH